MELTGKQWKPHLQQPYEAMPKEESMQLLVNKYIETAKSVAEVGVVPESSKRYLEGVIKDLLEAAEDPNPDANPHLAVVYKGYSSADYRKLADKVREAGVEAGFLKEAGG